MTTFLGKPFNYWIELQARAETLGVDSLLTDLVIANAKLKYYETKIEELVNFRNKADEMKRKS